MVPRRCTVVVVESFGRVVVDTGVVVVGVGGRVEPGGRGGATHGGVVVGTGRVGGGGPMLGAARGGCGALTAVLGTTAVDPGTTGNAAPLSERAGRMALFGSNLTIRPSSILTTSRGPRRVTPITARPWVRS